ncbi:hypothetical protein IOBOPIKK_00050 [Klebsiella phage vB_KpnS_SCNJ1-C]|nr:hypothetical protein IOBOPIKK_00050 [Klebsiella phage vB_KpnS_SCNJ1-C]
MATTPTNKPIPSEDPRDLKFNAGKIDEEVNGSADYYADRFGVQRLTNTGRNNQFQDQMTQQADDWLGQFNQQNSDFQQFLLNSGYQFLGDYENGPYTITARNQIIRYQNEFWRLNAATNPPYATTGVNSMSWATDVTHLVSVGDANLRQELSSENGSELVDYKHGNSGTLAYSLHSRLSTVLNLFDFIPAAKHDAIVNFTSTEDLSSYVQAAIDSANTMGGATIHCPAGQYYLNVKTKPNVILVGARGPSVRRAMPWAFSVSANPGSTRFRNFANDWIISSATASQSDVTSRSFGIIGIDFDAKDATNSTGGVRLRGPEICVKSCSFYGFQDQGLEASGNIGLFEDLIANECLKNRVRSDYVGTIEISGASDCQIHRLEGNAQVKGLGSITNAAPYICGIKIAGNNHYVSALMGEISETGIYISASSVHHKMWGCRADNNVGPGYLINGVMMDTCHSYNNSRTGDGLYSGFEALPGATRIMASNCLAWTDNAPVDGTGQQRLHKYGYDFAVVDYLSLRLKPWVDQCFSYGHSLGWINSPPTHGLQYTPTIGRLSVTSNATTTPNVDGVSVIAINTTSLSQITGLDGGMIGQQVDIYLNASATVTLVNSSSFLVNNLADHADKTMRVGQVYRFIKTATNIWREVGDVIRVLSGTTAARPSSTAVIGMQYFDTTLNKPIWRNANNSGWVDATGTAV